MTVSLFGDGIFLVAMAWQVYELWNAPRRCRDRDRNDGAHDRVPAPRRRRQRPPRPSDVMLAADRLRAVVIGLLALLSPTGALTLWELVVLCAVYGIGTAFFDPAFDAVVPDILPADQLAAGQRARPVREAAGTSACRPGGRRWLIASIGLGRYSRSTPLASACRPSR